MTIGSMHDFALQWLAPLLAVAPEGGEARDTMFQTVFVAIAAGSLLLIVARRVNLPAIVLLLVGGVLLGPQVLGLVEPESLGSGMGVIVSLAIGLILFEGGLTLDLTGYRSASTMIKRLLTIGVLITWLVSAAALVLIVGVSIPMAVVAASLIIVTGPTVIAPLLKRIRVTPRLHSILHWEGVLIDPIGVFIAILCFEGLAMQGGQTALANFALRFVFGLAIGVAGGMGMHAAIRTRLVSPDLYNVFALAMAVLVFGLAESLLPEAGLLAVTVAGFVLGLKNPGRLKEMRQFKAELTDILIGTLFVLLTARLSFEQFETFGWRGFLAVAAVMFIVRPLSIFVCARGSSLSRQEKLFLSWVAPRGIVAASLASLVAISLEQSGTFEGDPRFIETFTYSVIICTIAFQGLSADFVARLLGVRQPAPTGWLIVGAHPLSRRIASFLRSTANIEVALVDSNARAVADARAAGLLAFREDALDPELRERAQLLGLGHLLALTDNEELNMLLCQRWGDVFGQNHVYRWSTNADGREGDDRSGQMLWRKLPKPSLISNEIARGEATTIIAPAAPTSAAAPDRIMLMGVNAGRLVIDFADLDDDDLEKVESCLYVRRASNYLSRAVRPELILRMHDVADAEGMFERVIDIICSLDPAIDRNEMLHEVTQRHVMIPAALGEGVAVPHGYSRTSANRWCAIARIDEGVDFRAPDGQPVQLVFLLISPVGDPEGHLATIAEIARLVVDPENRRKLVEADDPADVLTLIRSIELS
jgi:NhaP-type Na+/H+ or K+/H+ antiporter/mannitol/fructose-specific phosphotransferase system IIA component (Ntr-type)